MKIQFADQKMLLADVNFRSEIHGDDRVPAADVKLACDVPNDVLDMIDPVLKGMFFTFDSGRSPDLVDQGRSGDASYLPHLRASVLAPVQSFMAEMVGCRIQIAVGQRQVVLQDVKVNAVKAEMRDGGTVHLQIRVQAHPDEGAGGMLSTWIQSEVQVTLAAPTE